MIKRRAAMIIAVCITLALGAAVAEGVAPSVQEGMTDIRLLYKLPEDWVSMEISEQAAQIGMLNNAVSPDGKTMLQIFAQQGTTLDSVEETLAVLDIEGGIEDARGEATPYIAYSIQNMRCYVIQASETDVLALNFMITDEDGAGRADEIAKGIIASITVNEAQEQ